MYQTLPIAPPAPARLTTNQIRGFWAAWGGWALDGMDSFIYALVLTPAITELLPRSGIVATPGNVVYYGSVLLALFMIGWGLSMFWGPFADRFGRVAKPGLGAKQQTIHQNPTTILPNTCRLSMRFSAVATSSIGTSVSITGCMPPAILSRLSAILRMVAPNEPKMRYCC